VAIWKRKEKRKSKKTKTRDLETEKGVYREVIGKRRGFATDKKRGRGQRK